MSRLSILLVAALMISSTAPAISAAGEAALLEATVLKRRDLPEDFWFPFMELGFAVIRVKVVNSSAEGFVIPAEISVSEKKGKRYRQVGPSEITPRVVKSKLTRRSRPVHGTATVGSAGPPPYGRSSHPYPLPGAGASAGRIDVATVQQIKSILERHQWQTGRLAAGETYEALIYLKTKKRPTQVVGGQVTVAGLSSVQIAGAQ